MTLPLSRRGLLLGLGATGLLAAGCRPPDRGPSPEPDPRPLVHGVHQAGVASPATAQRHCDLSVWDAPGADWPELLHTLGERITALTGAAPRPQAGVRGPDALLPPGPSGEPADPVATAAPHTGPAPAPRVPEESTAVSPALAGLEPGDLTVTVGIGPKVVAGLGKDLPGSADLPRFAREQVKDEHRGGELLLQVCATDPMVVSLAVTELLRGLDLRSRWRQTAFRGAARPDGAARNIFGFTDGIVVPRGDKELNEEVWLDSGATIAVVRRLRLDVPGFLAQPLARQEEVFGRRRDTSEPLSGGGPDAEVDLTAKSADGEYLVPADSHVRRAHPLTSGSGLMLRRSYSYDDGPEDRGLLFISFQRDLRTFVATQHRLDEGDALMKYATPTASGTFLVLPGFSPDRPLGSSLFR
ncbi:deferrochelatase/peroxidase EfeB [Crossiella equi]|uniref:Deferrochelatase/peroxidase EfeB n=1 Tax=Crossiella equi TaxID=130796 RepID=A0ABS5AIM4_9PSEU|nr:Dyp-type peroxidase [Crossiella equi]MBP2475555.1 deferrochelatase/peroxidase EfeB [Crossiella equi]